MSKSILKSRHQLLDQLAEGAREPVREPAFCAAWPGVRTRRQQSPRLAAYPRFVASDRRRGITATELIAERERRIREDPEYRRQVERVEAELAERANEFRVAEQPILADLAAAGVQLDTVWHLYKTPALREPAIPVLLDHLTRDYPDRVLEGIASGLQDRGARPWWPDLSALYLTTEREVVRDRLAAALAVCAMREHYGQLLAFVANPELGESRIYFLRPINRIGNRISAGKGRSVIESLAADPVMGREATAILKGRGLND
jgi:hypothetical protein